MPSYRLTPISGVMRPVLLSDRAVTLGRGRDNTIPLLDERASRNHCQIEPDGVGGWLLRDLNSRNGTKVNEVRVLNAVLKPGDVIRIGASEFVFESDAEVAAVDSSGETPPLGIDTPLRDSQQVGWMFRLAETISSLPPKGQPPEPVSLIDARGRKSDVLTSQGSDGPNAIRMLLQLASRARATDIHFEPKGESMLIRMRVDGEMVEIVEMPQRVQEVAYGLVKAVCAMGQASRDAVQEGHFSSVFPDRRVEYRVSFTPSVHAQKLVIRVLDERGSPENLGQLGMPQYMLDRIRQVCSQDSGLLLSCGPTGSGKTTTLYNAIREIDRRTHNVVTIEDPVEYQLDHVTQIPIDEHKGNTFGTLLKSVLRQDPDVILVGEIRDDETARTAMQAALTGHLVFSSIHAKETISAVFRLLDLKVEPYLVANALNLILSQRLVRVLCETCKREMPVSPGQATRLGRFLGGRTTVFTATGCARCLRTGYRGRRAIFELLDFNDELRDIVLRSPSITAMKKVIEQGLFTTLQQSGWKLVAEGTTTLDEVDRVAGVG